MERMKNWTITLLTLIGGELQYRADRLGHLTTDPACIAYRAPRAGSHLDRISRGLACGECMMRRAFAGEICGYRFVGLTAGAHVCTHGVGHSIPHACWCGCEFAPSESNG